MPAAPASQADRAPARAAAGRHVLIDALAARFGGTAYAAVQLARHLAAREEVSAVTVVARRESIVQRGIEGQAGVRCIALPDARRMELARRTAWEAARLPVLAKREGCDAVISMSGMLPRSPACKAICLLFNPVMYETHTLANRLRRWAVRRTARSAACLAAPSGLMAELASAATGRPCAVIPLGIDHDVFTPAAAAGSEVLCVADFYAHKRHDLLIEAWSRLPAPKPLLRLVGNPGVDEHNYARLLARVRSLGGEGEVVFQSGLSLKELLETYRRARLFVIASERESFCMPLAESMACGVPAVARDLSSLRETGGDGALYIDGDDPVEWAAALRKLIEDDLEHERMRKAAISSAARFSWEAFAANLAAQL